MFQLKLPFPDGMMEKVKTHYAISDMMKMEQKIQSLENTVRTYKGHFTKKDKRNGKNV